MLNWLTQELPFVVEFEWPKEKSFYAFIMNNSYFVFVFSYIITKSPKERAVQKELLHYSTTAFLKHEGKYLIKQYA